MLRSAVLYEAIHRKRKVYLEVAHPGADAVNAFERGDAQGATRFYSNPATGFRGHIGEAQAQGGRVFSTSGDVWNILRPDLGGNGRIWSVNREFLQAQMESGVARIELRGGAIDDILRTRPTSYSAAEIKYLQRYGYEYGYRLDGNTGVKVGDWRASTGGRAAGGAVGPGLDVIDDAQR